MAVAGVRAGIELVVIDPFTIAPGCRSPSASFTDLEPVDTLNQAPLAKIHQC